MRLAVKKTARGLYPLRIGVCKNELPRGTAAALFTRPFWEELFVLLLHVFRRQMAVYLRRIDAFVAQKFLN